MDIQHLLHSNTPPSDSESEFIHQLIAAGVEEARLLHKYESATASANQAAIDRLSRLQSIKDEEMLALRRIVSALRHFPAEILVEIFILHVQQETKFGSTHRSFGPIVLSQVSSRWRSIALGSPRIWDTLRFSLGLVPRKNPLRCVDELIRRSHPHGISILVSSREPPPDKIVSKFTSPLLEQIFRAPEFTARVEKLNLVLAAAHFFDVVKLGPQIYPALRTLRIAPRNSLHDQTVAIHEMLNLFQQLPSLRVLKIVVPHGSAYPQYTGAVPPFPWSQLESLDFRCSLEARVVHAILSQCHSLRKGLFFQIRFDEEATLPASVTELLEAATEVVTLPFMEHLTLQGWGSLRYPLLQRLRLPNLRTLDIRNLKSPRNTRVDILGGLQERSGFSLTSLKLRGGLETRFIPAFLQRNPEITELFIGRQDIFARLQYLPGKPVILPNLRSLTVAMKNDDDYQQLEDDGEHLAQMLASRTLRLPQSPEVGECARLHKVNIRISGYRLSNIAEDVFERLTQIGCLTDHIEREYVDGSDEEEYSDCWYSDDSSGGYSLGF
ncbi:hypothetical protein C8F01DRAFT_1106168 [Mycena amicta]|nr:hypothetical protein C8F01DRAFT_1106168 [Mycena amicta]